MRRKRPLIKPNSIRSVKHFFEKSLRKNFENLKNGTLGSREARCESEERLWTSRSDLTRSFFKKVKRTNLRKIENTAKIKNKQKYVMKNYFQKKSIPHNQRPEENIKNDGETTSPSFPNRKYRESHSAVPRSRKASSAAKSIFGALRCALRANSVPAAVVSLKNPQFLRKKFFLSGVTPPA